MDYQKMIFWTSEKIPSGVPEMFPVPYHAEHPSKYPEDTSKMNQVMSPIKNQV